MTGIPDRLCILLAQVNPDLRDHLHHVLGESYDVITGSF